LAEHTGERIGKQDGVKDDFCPLKGVPPKTGEAKVMFEFGKSIIHIGPMAI
jgi:hypothetical protein